MKDKNLEVKHQIQQLVEKINQWDWEYYMLDAPSVSDSEYDSEYKRLQALEETFSDLILPNSPTLKLGAWNNEKFAKVIHQKPMLSLNKAYSKEDVFKFLNDIKQQISSDISFNCEPKIDGLSISLKYVDGRLIQALTRGNGIEGDDVTENVFQIENLPKQINYLKPIEIRGEVYLSKTRFNQLNKKLETDNKKLLANPRNAAAGTLKLLDKNIVKERGLSIILYDITDPILHNINLQSDVVNFLNQLNLPTSKHNKTSADFDEIWNFIKEFKEIKNSFEYDCDGFVIKLNNLKYWDSLGRTSKFPKYAIAYKYETEEKVAKIKEIIATVGRTGKITYVANFKDKVELNQTWVSNATLHNYEYIKDMNININDDVLVIKSGEIIPKVIALVHKNSDGIFKKVTKCPSCNQLLHQNDSLVDQFCINQHCPEQKIRALIHFCSKQCVNIESLGNEIIKLFYQKGYINTFSSIYMLNKYKNDIIKLPSFGNSKSKNKEYKKIDNILSSIDKSKSIKLANALFALGIPNVGKTAATLIAAKITKLTDLTIINLNSLLQINTIGQVIIDSIKSFIKNPNMLEEIYKLDSIFEYINDDIKTSDLLKGKNFVITGTLSKSRDFFKDQIIKNGGNVVSSISKNTNFLLAGENAGSKLQKAYDLGIKVINEDYFNQMIKI
ncbi:NAD-dependent DNA ligase LigA [Mycoplasma sp. 6243]|uniref:NAD-dependent DNA ligase LigA n=1 Tax=Mycoplasma sp. 6243 TaxID=3440865 RepID=UPI003EBD8072